jgi:HlyD family secretion protein
MIMKKAMKRALKIIFTLLFVAVVGFGLVSWAKTAGGKKNGFTLVDVKKGTIVDKALAVGQIVPRKEVQVKSQISGIVKEYYVDVGDPVKAGDPLFSIIPDPTPLELTDAERQIEIAKVTFDKAQADLDRYGALQQDGLITAGDFDAKKETYDHARIQLEMAKERYSLIKEGKIKRASGNNVDSVIRAPASGTVLERVVNAGDPVVPLTSYQAGTVLMTLADMGDLIFKGTVDEIDVGKLKDALPVRIQIGALPTAQVKGQLARIAPKAKEKDGATLFDVEVTITDAGGVVLRAGFSANSDIVIREKENVLIIPERLVSFEGSKAFVEIPAADPKKEPVRKEIKTGLSDGLQVEVLEGLKEGDKVVQRPPKEIT